jgi:DNA-binding response OmpR family regulator
MSAMARATILIVDDSPLTVDAVRLGLESCGFAVRSASDLEGVPRPLRDHEIDLVLLDVEMAEMFGDDLAMILREEHGPPIVLLSALADAELAERADAAETNGWISKHSGVAEVVARVEAMLGEPSRGRAEVDLSARLRETAARRVRTARAALGAGDRDHLRQVAYELHALIGEAAVLGHAELAARAQDGRHAAEACLADPDDAALRACADALATIETALAAIAARPTPIAAPGGSPAGGPTVLLLDDSELYRATLRAILEERGYQVEEAGSAARGRARLAGAPCDLVILDVELGDGSGLDLIPLVRAHMPRAALVVISGGDAMTQPDGADLVLLKTLDPTTVLVKLDRVLAQARDRG